MSPLTRRAFLGATALGVLTACTTTSGTGGPLVLPGLFDGRGKAFYFLHYEQLRFPNSFTRTRTVLREDVLDGWYTYDVGGQTRRVNLLDLARASGQSAAQIADSRGQAGSIVDAAECR